MNSVVFKIAVAASAVLFAACGGRQENRKGEKLDFGSATMDAGKSIVGEWDIAGIMCGDSIAISPAETMPGVDVAMELAADETYVVRTGCNTISGSYASRGNSIKFADGVMTEMACDDMAVEDALRPAAASRNRILRVVGRWRDGHAQCVRFKRHHPADEKT